MSAPRKIIDHTPMITAVRMTVVRRLFRQMFRHPIWKIIGLLHFLLFLTCFKARISILLPANPPFKKIAQRFLSGSQRLQGLQAPHPQGRVGGREQCDQQNDAGADRYR
jgi:hypothetical protein